MKIENQVCTLEQAKRLKELGIIQKSIFYYHPAFERPVFGEMPVTETGKQYKKTQVCNDKKGSLSAFTVAELGMMLDYANVEKAGLPEHNGKWCFPIGPKAEHAYYPTEAQARAQRLILNLEKGWLTAEQVNHCLQVA